MRRENARLHAELKSTMIYVTHDQVEAMTLADRIVVLDGGAVQQVGTPMELYHHPANIFVAGFIGSPKMNFVEGRVAGLDEAGVAVETPGFGRLDVGLAETRSIRIGDSVTLGVQPEDCVLRPSSGSGARVSVRQVEELGDETLLEAVTHDGEILVVKAQPAQRVRGGDTIGLSFDPRGLHLFDANGKALSRERKRNR